MQIVVSQVSSEPLYEQIKNQIRTAVYTGAIKAGETLPSLRELARDLQVSLITVTRAYNDLASEKVIGTRQGKGTVVLPVDPALLHAHVEVRIQQALNDAVAAARLGGIDINSLHDKLSSAWDVTTNKINQEQEDLK